MMKSNEMQMLLLILCGLGLIVFIIFILRIKDEGYDYDAIIAKLNEEEQKDLENLKSGNREINEIESKILKCKKELGIKLFNK